jgi:hypothetical protein
MAKQTQSIKDKQLTADEIEKLKSCVNAVVVNLQYAKDIADQTKELVSEVADELEINGTEIKDAARTLFMQNLAAKRAKQTAMEELLETLGYTLDEE